MKAGRGYLYYVSFAGVTGAAHLEVEAVREKVAQIKALGELPVAAGFGVRDGESARRIGEIADAVVIATHHAAFDLPLLATHADLIIDTRNAMAGVTTRPGQVVKA